MARAKKGVKEKPCAIFLCDFTGNMAEPWAKAGITCYCIDIDIQKNKVRKVRREGNIHFIWGDVRSWFPPEYSKVLFVAGFPPCTHLASSGACDFKIKGNYLLADSLELWATCYQLGRWSGAPYMVENPVGVISHHMREPDYIFDPCEYAGYLDEDKRDTEAYTKKTCLWTGNGFVMPEPKRVTPILGSLMHRLPEGKGRADLRSATPKGFARAVFLANKPAELPTRNRVRL